MLPVWHEGRKIGLLLAVLIGGVSCGQIQESGTQANPSQSSAASPAPQPQGIDTHQDHNPKHGGTFFMAMDNFHHLEGVLEAPGVFRLYLYDNYTKPLTPDKVKQTSGKVLVGESEEAPEIPLTPSRDGKTLEAKLDNEIKLPVTLTLLLRFPETVSDARPELFTFPFQEYSKPVTAQ